MQVGSQTTPQHTMSAQQPGPDPPQAAPVSPHGPASTPPSAPPPPPPWICSTHCAEWLCELTSWNGSQNAGNERSLLSRVVSGSTITAAIQICGCSQVAKLMFCLLAGMKFGGTSSFHGA